MQLLLVLCAVLAVASADLNSVSYHRNIGDRVDDYVKMHRLQQSKILNDYDTKLKHAEELYLIRVGGLDLQLDMALESIIQNEEVLNPYEVLSDRSKHCVNEYRPALVSKVSAEMAIKDCIAKANSQADALLNKAIRVRNQLESHYKKEFENGVVNCGRNFPNNIANYTRCVIGVASESVQFTSENQKLFDVEMDAVECIAKANVKAAFDCTYAVQAEVISKITESSVLIDHCVTLTDKCQQCDAKTTCSYTLVVDSHSRTVVNPFYNNDSQDCVLLELAPSYTE